jgi:hypothetical protein
MDDRLERMLTPTRRERWTWRGKATGVLGALGLVLWLTAGESPSSDPEVRAVAVAEQREEFRQEMQPVYDDTDIREKVTMTFNAPPFILFEPPGGSGWRGWFGDQTDNTFIEPAGTSGCLSGTQFRTFPDIVQERTGGHYETVVKSGAQATVQQEPDSHILRVIPYPGTKLVDPTAPDMLRLDPGEEGGYGDMWGADQITIEYLENKNCQ